MDEGYKRSRRCSGCEYCKLIHAQDGWEFHGCKCKPYRGKMCAEISDCPIGKTYESTLKELKDDSIFGW